MKGKNSYCRGRSRVAFLAFLSIVAIACVIATAPIWLPVVQQWPH